jgi:hypothetical protein
MKKGDWNLARNLFNESKIRWGLGTFKQFKLARTDEFVSTLLQQVKEGSVPHLCCIFRACLAYRYISMAWRQVNVLFISKPGESDCT